MSEQTSPRDVVHRQITAIEQQDWATAIDLYAEETVVDQPFGVPRARWRGREHIREHFARAAQLPLRLHARDIVVHETNDPEVVVVEFDYDGVVTTTGRRFTVTNVLIVRVRDGRIVSSRDYHDHLRLADAMDGTFDLVAALAASPSSSG